MMLFIHAILAALLTQQPTTQTPGSNILITECRPHLHSYDHAHPYIDPYGVWHHDARSFPAFDAFIAIGYRNQSRLTARQIDFGLIVRGSLVAVAKDVGSFPPGALIQHEFVVSREIFPLNATSASCAVLHVKYADGSNWFNERPEQI